eukprot:10889867-Lingulodinium_polyedra.AAC.1
MELLRKSKPPFANPTVPPLLATGWPLKTYAAGPSVTKEELAAKNIGILVLTMMGFVAASRASSRAR